MENRKYVLLRAAYDLLKRTDNAPFPRVATHITVYYDESNCDGFCLMEDIANELGIDTNEDPIPLEDDDE